MSLSKDQIVHDLAVACVNGIVHEQILKNNSTDIGLELGVTLAESLAVDVVMAYKSAWDEIYPMIEVTE